MHQHRITVTSISALLAFVASSCGVGVDMAFRADRSAALALSVEVPQPVEAKLRQFAAADSRPAMFDAAAIAASVAARGIAVRESVSPDGRSWRGAFSIADIEKLLAGDKDLASVLSFNRGPGWASIRLRVDRSNALALARLFPGLDGQLLEALQPPALYDNPVSSQEYRTMLIRLFGPFGFQEYQTNEPNICLKPENIFMARIGNIISKEVQTEFKWLRFGVSPGG